MKLYVFNPDTDMALGNNKENYMPPASARQMSQDIALLPIWYAPPGSAVLAPSAYNAAYLQEMKRMFPISAQLVTEPELPDYAECQVMPWGWNPAFRKRMLKGGIAEHRLPALDELAGYRMMASRIHTISLCRILDFGEASRYTCGEHRVIEGDGKGEFADALTGDLTHIAVGNRENAPARNLKDALAGGLTNGYVFKSVWSGSGKGLRWCRQGLTKPAADWCNRQLSEYGAVIVEPIYNKVGDFAMEFYSDGQGKVLFIGYSRFTTDENGAYRGNLMVSDTEVERWLGQYVPREAIVCIRERLLTGLEGIYGKCYTGTLGIDMMVCLQEDGASYAIHPHVEINVRMTMGIVAHQFYKNFAAPGSEGVFSVDYYPSNDILRLQHERDEHDYPLVVEKGRIVSGYLPLTPVTPKSCYRVYVRL
ncbi:hypothetical protein [Bacteroides sp. UBA939]|uniref:hypothetical protein n=1 Tax=Bacteroides sp. UBA939 TaxID=1946092 RepID=UPI0025BAB35A|nr:hypothetical protein [Bacteroides sp. UBA939]